MKAEVKREVNIACEHSRVQVWAGVGLGKPLWLVAGDTVVTTHIWELNRCSERWDTNFTNKDVQLYINCNTGCIEKNTGEQKFAGP